jgi:hypothetical protein
VGLWRGTRYIMKVCSIPEQHLIYTIPAPVAYSPPSPLCTAPIYGPGEAMESIEGGRCRRREKREGRIEPLQPWHVLCCTR